ncbi:MAG: LytTR family DNA-binding domain-containing protein [Eubacterium sp.]|nr:LytTR family DNA-binding domain-containing protein [Eubacterium sp.]
MNIAIVDDLEDEIRNLEIILTEYTEANGLGLSLSTFDSGEAFLKDYEPYRYTVVFLDIYMGGITGIETAGRIREKDQSTLIIFLTTSMEHMGSAFSIHAYDYIEKPAERERIFHLMDDILSTRTTLYSKTVDFMYERRAHRIPVPDVVSISTGEANYLNIEDKKGNMYHPRTTFSAVCDDLADETSFLMVNRGVMVNMEYISRISEGECLLKNGKVFPVFTRKAVETRQKWQNYVFNNVRTKQRGKRSAARNEAKNEN